METYQKADHRNPKMGLDNQICNNPKYWCRLHQVWLSEADVEKKTAWLDLHLTCWESKSVTALKENI